MKTLRTVLVGGFLVASLWQLTSWAAEPAVTPALVGGQVLDGYGGPPIQDGVVLIAGERIVAVGPLAEIAVPVGAEVISTEGMTVGASTAPPTLAPKPRD